jgi:hypothetical protein
MSNLVIPTTFLLDPCSHCPSTILLKAELIILVIKSTTVEPA